MDPSQKPQTCLIIGAAGGIGRSLAHRLSARGWRLVLAGRTERPLIELASTVTGDVAVLDATDFAGVADVFSRYPEISAAVNLAGSILLKPAHTTTAEEFDATIALNLRTSFALVRAAGRFMRGLSGNVVLMSSCAAAFGLPNHDAIAAAKAGVEGLVRAAAATYASSGLRFNAVAPGLIDTPLAERITRCEPALRASMAMHPLGRIATPVEVAGCIEFLLSEDAGFITGQTLAVDGGMSRVRSK